MLSFLIMGCDSLIKSYNEINIIYKNYRGTFENNFTGVVAVIDRNSVNFSGGFEGAEIGDGTITLKKYIIDSANITNDYYLHNYGYIKKYVLYTWGERRFAYFPDCNNNKDIFYVYGLHGEFVRKK